MHVKRFWSFFGRDCSNSFSRCVFSFNETIYKGKLPFLNGVNVYKFFSGLMNFLFLLSVVGFEFWDEFFNFFVFLGNFIFMLLLHVQYHLLMLFIFCLNKFLIYLFGLSFSKLLHFWKLHISLCLSCNAWIQFMNNFSLFINDLMGMLKHALKFFISFL